MATQDALSGDPMIGAHFEVSVGAVTGYFTEVSGLGSENEIVEHKIIAKGAKGIHHPENPRSLEVG